jgi:hypothetical protein
MVEITLAEAVDILNQIERNNELPPERKAPLVERQYRIIVRLLIQKANDHDRAFQTLFDRFGKSA